MPRLKLTVEYDGTDFVGWQRQLNGRSVQEEVERALSTLLGTTMQVSAAGRTDSGVHALGQVVSFATERRLPLKAYGRGLNGILPPDVSIARVEEVPDDFEARRWALSKHYRYLVSNAPHRSALRRRTHWEVFAPLDVDAMVAAAPCLVGRLDYSAFRAADCQADHALRVLNRVSVQREGADVITFDVEGTAFLKHMVRTIVGSLVEVGKGKVPPGWLKDVLESKDRALAGPTAPPEGLTLVSVRYGAGRPEHLGPRPDETTDD